MAERQVCSTCSIKTFSPGGGATQQYLTSVLLGDGNCDRCVHEARRLAGLGDGVGSKDGTGHGDRDVPYTFGRSAAAVAAMPSQVQSGLLKLRGAILERKLAAHRPAPIDPDGLA